MPFGEVVDREIDLKTPSREYDRESSEMGLKMPSREYDGESSEIGLKMPSRKGISCIRDSFASIPVPAVEGDFTGEC